MANLISQIQKYCGHEVFGKSFKQGKVLEFANLMLCQKYLQFLSKDMIQCLTCFYIQSEIINILQLQYLCKKKSGTLVYLQ